MEQLGVNKTYRVGEGQVKQFYFDRNLQSNYL